MNKRGRIQHRALLVSDEHIFKLDPNKGYQRKKLPVHLQEVQGFGISPHIDQGFIIHLRGGSDLICYLLCPDEENRVAELCAVLFQSCRRYITTYMYIQYNNLSKKITFIKTTFIKTTSPPRLDWILDMHQND